VAGDHALASSFSAILSDVSKPGDRRQTVFSIQSLANMLERFGIAVSPAELKIENVAAVLVTTQMGPYAQPGVALDVTVSSIGDARSLQGGTLLPTPLRGLDGQVMALAQGPLSISGFGGGNGDSSVQVNHLTVGRVPGGALLQVSRPTPLLPSDTLRLGLFEPDFIAATRVAAVINRTLGEGVARAIDAGTVTIAVPAPYRADLSGLIATLEPMLVEMDRTARVVINERTGTVVMGSEVKLGAAAVAHGSLSVRIATQNDVSQPAPFSGGQTTRVTQTEVEVTEAPGELMALEASPTLADVVRALNLLGASPRDLIAIMQALKAAGALRAELIIL
jgi:flagellar P-ring protein precursor FlgI